MTPHSIQRKGEHEALSYPNDRYLEKPALSTEASQKPKNFAPKNFVLSYLKLTALLYHPGTFASSSYTVHERNHPALAHSEQANALKHPESDFGRSIQKPVASKIFARKIQPSPITKMLGINTVHKMATYRPQIARD